MVELEGSEAHLLPQTHQKCICTWNESHRVPAGLWQTTSDSWKGKRILGFRTETQERTGVGCVEIAREWWASAETAEGVHGGQLATLETRCQCLGMSKARGRTHCFPHMHIRRGQDTACTGSRSRHGHYCCPPRHQEGHSCCHLPLRLQAWSQDTIMWATAATTCPDARNSQTTIAAPLGLQEWSRAASMSTVCSGGATTATRNSRSRSATASAHPHQGDTTGTLWGEAAGIHAKDSTCTKYIKPSQVTQGCPLTCTPRPQFFLNSEWEK